MVGPNVSEDIRIQQLVWNLQSQTPTILRMLSGAKPMTREQWNEVLTPTLIIAGEEVYSAMTVWLTSGYSMSSDRRRENSGMVDAPEYTRHVHRSVRRTRHYD
jgi:hypothetical protein